MKYVKLFTAREQDLLCIDVPLGHILPASYIGKIGYLENGIVRKIRRYDKGNLMWFRDIGQDIKFTGGQICEFYLAGAHIMNNNAERFRHVYDEENNRVVSIVEFNASTWPELVMKMTVAGCVYSTDGEVMEIPEAVKLVSEQKDSILSLNQKLMDAESELDRFAKELSEKNGRILELEKELDSVRKCERQPARSWKRVFENMFGSEDDVAYEA